MWEQLEIAAQYQYYWADNSVSITVTFQEHEKDEIKDALKCMKQDSKQYRS